MVQVQNNSRFSEADLGYRKSIHSSFLSVGIAAVASPNEPIRMDADHVALIDEIVLTARTNDAATNVTALIHINGQTINVLGAPATVAPHVLRFHFPGAANVVRSDKIHLRPLGKMIVKPSSTLWVQASAVTQIGCQISFRVKSTIAALRDGDLSPNGELPAVASTNSVAAAGTVADTAKNIIPGVAGKSIEILGLYHTGHNFAAGQDDNRLGFWNGVTGTFAANGSMVMRLFAMGADPRWAPRVLIDDTRGCIQGPVGEGVFIQASANMASANDDKASYVVSWRYVPSPIPLVAAGVADSGTTTTMVDAALIATSIQMIGKVIRFTSGANMGQYRIITAFASATGTVTWVLVLPAAVVITDTFDIVEVKDVATPTGVVGQAPIGRKKFWYTTELDPTGNLTVPLFPTSVITASGSSNELVLHGHVCSGVFVDSNESIAGMGLGALPAIVGWSEYTSSKGDGNAVTVANSWSRHGANLTANIAGNPGFVAIEGGPEQFTSRFQLCWGTFRHSSGGSTLVVVSDTIA
jgi:hypothetical protein